MEVPKSPSKYKRIAKHKSLIKSGLVILVMLLLFLGFYLESETGKLNASSYYTVVVDCGSTGTRVNVYEWMVGVKGASKGNLPVLLHSYPDNTTKKSSLWKGSCQYHCMQTEPGLHNFVNDSLGVRQALEPLIVWAEQVVPREMRGSTPAFVLATAGLRGLALEDADRVLGDIEAVVKGHSFMMSKSWIRVLSGKEEAYYGWVALNYKMGTFDDNYPKSPTLGLVDIGGSSLQIVAEIDLAVDDVHVMKSRLGSTEHRIMAYSLPAFGLNEAFDRTVLRLRNNQSEERTASISDLRHPCLLSTYVQNYTCHSCSALASIYEKKHSQDHESELYSLRLTGEPNWEQCRELAIGAAMNSSSKVSHLTVSKNCQASLFSGTGTDILNLTAVAQPAKFHALSGFFFVYNKLNLSPRTNLTMVWESGKQICSNLWSGLSSVSDNPDYAGLFCFQVAYMASLIDYGLCLGDVEMVFGPGDISWTLGAALIEGNFLWLNSTSYEAHVIISTLKNVKTAKKFDIIKDIDGTRETLIYGLLNHGIPNYIWI
ncbi:probable apyrase 7 isoform X4 [Vigna radiata var. radiata]|uniref:Probable apyrase 7 isoform X4 n=1 Tax=Vigna radiata var. radiata TaxID=3916 RepID=A0A3Q0EQ64_VIGRR|nr:probable apyrase 7 isoform X4 [Vigna radiata var. radiata]